MDKLPFAGLDVFFAVHKHGSLRSAASALGVQPPAISYQLKALEDRIGVALFVRTTRSVKLTEAGRTLLTKAQPAISDLVEALEAARASGQSRKGTIRITLPLDAYEIAIAKKLAAFQTLYPDIILEMSFNEATEDIVAEGFHAGVRQGDIIADDMIAVRLSPPAKEAVFGSPDYFDRHGRPDRPEDLVRHTCIQYRYIASKRIAEWQFHGDDGITTIDVRGNLIFNSTAAVLSAARDGLGISWLFRQSVDDDLRAGRLETVLEPYSIERPGYFLFYPRANARIEVLRVFIDFMRDRPGTNALMPPQH